MKKATLISLAIFSEVAFVFAEITGDQLFQNVMKAIFEPLLQLMIVIASLYFLFGVVKFIWAAREGKEEDMNKGKLHLLWGTVGLFIMLSIGGILRLLNSSVGGMF
ncbi:MAG: hypothetical protein QG653_577 [Patescibacteria group bacterium]|nr:hypothetical protein [Patescibacteria group bacterium]